MADFDWNKFHEFTKKYDPGGHYAVDHGWKLTTRLVEPGTKAVTKIFGNDRLERANERDQNSIDTTIENSIAGIGAWFGGSYLANGLGGGSSAGGGGGGGAGAGGTTYLEAGGGAVTSGADGGLSWINADGSVGSAAANGAEGFNWRDIQQSGNQQKQQERPKSQQYEVVQPQYGITKPEETLSSRYEMLSDKNAKVRGGGKLGIQRAIARGLAGEDPIDENGVQVMQIQALHRRLVRLEVAIKTARAKRKGAH